MKGYKDGIYALFEINDFRSGENGYRNAKLELELRPFNAVKVNGRETSTLDKYIDEAIAEFEERILKRALELEQKEYDEVKTLALIQVDELAKEVKKIASIKAVDKQIQNAFDRFCVENQMLPKVGKFKILLFETTFVFDATNFIDSLEALWGLYPGYNLVIENEGGAIRWSFTHSITFPGEPLPLKRLDDNSLVELFNIFIENCISYD